MDESSPFAEQILGLENIFQVLNSITGGMASLGLQNSGRIPKKLDVRGVARFGIDKLASHQKRLSLCQNFLSTSSVVNSVLWHGRQKRPSPTELQRRSVGFRRWLWNSGVSTIFRHMHS